MRFSCIAWAGLTIALASSASAAQRQALANSVLPAVSRSRVVGTVPVGERIHVTISLAPRFPAELEAYCNSVSNPISPDFRKFLTPQQVGENFGAPAKSVNDAVAFLKANGLKIQMIAPNRMAILANGTAAQLQTAFGTTLKRLAGPAPDSRATTIYRSNTQPLSVPSNLAGVITNVYGLSNLKRVKHRQVLSPSQVRTLYTTATSYAGGMRGQGITIGINNYDGLRLSNAALYINANGLPTPPGGAASNIEIISVGTPAHTGTPAGEGDLDFQMVLGTAPLATIKIYDSTDDLIGILARQSTDNSCDIITESWGYALTNEEAIAAHNQHLALTAQGITYMGASGDEGTFLGEFDYPNFDPEVLMVGATTATTDSAGNRTAEDGWNGTGSGWSERNISFNKLPYWQVGNGVPTNRNFRLFPDLALHGAGAQNIASGAGHLVYVNGSIAGFVGTSCSAPLFAGLLATVHQRLVAAGQAGRLGRIQDYIYSQNGRSDVWFDVTNGNTGFLPDGTFGTGHAGWDWVTGWGAPDMNGLYSTLLGRTLQGGVSLGNWAVSPAGVSIKVDLYQVGTSTLVQSTTGVLASDGSYVVTTSAPNGSYDIYAKGSHWLRRKAANVTVSASGAASVNFALANGDITGDNVVSLADFAQLRAAFGSMPSSPNWNPNADLNGDLAVSLADFSILRANFGQSGD